MGISADRPLVYICSPFSGDIEGNTKKAREYSRFAVDQGAIPLAPHLFLPQFMSEQNERELAMFMVSITLKFCTFFTLKKCTDITVFFL